MTEKHIILASGGTGGHIFPAESLAKSLLDDGYKVTLITDARYKKRKTTPADMGVVVISSASTAGGFFKKITAVFSIIAGVFQAKKTIKQIGAKKIVGFGGYPSFPVMLAAIFLKKEIIIHEQNAVMGKVNRIIAPKAKKIATSFEYVERIEKSDREKITVTGNPVRNEIKALHGVPYNGFEQGGTFNILVTGGSQGAKIFSDIIPSAIENLSNEQKKIIRIDQQCRPEDVGRVKEFYSQHNINACVQAFFEDIPAKLAACHLIISRSGASTMAEVMVAGRPSVLVPYMHASDDHQSVNARLLEKSGGAIVIKQQLCTTEIVASTIESFINNPESLKRIAINAFSMAHVNATENLKKLVL